MWHDQGEWVGKIISIFSYRPQEVTNSYLLLCFWTSLNWSYLCNRMFNWDAVWARCSILNGQIIFVGKSKLNVEDMWLILLDCVIYFYITWAFCLRLVPSGPKRVSAQSDRLNKQQTIDVVTDLDSFLFFLFSRKKVWHIRKNWHLYYREVSLRLTRILTVSLLGLYS